MEEKIERLQEGYKELIEVFNLPIEEVRALLFEEDYPPLDPGDLGVLEEEMFRELEW